jgi:hypothetical protein
MQFRLMERRRITSPVVLVLMGSDKLNPAIAKGWRNRGFVSSPRPAAHFSLRLDTHNSTYVPDLAAADGS